MSATRRRGGNPGKLPHHGKLPIPWITRRANERPPAKMDISYGKVTDGPYEDKLAVLWPRDELGWPWIPEQGTGGEPEFKQVSPSRQRQAMDELRCQVCSKRLLIARANWLVPTLPDPGEPLDTEHPPVCDKCLPLARAMCPHLRRAGGWTLVRCERHEPVAVMADIYSPITGRRVFGGPVYPEHPQALLAIARQRIVRLHDWQEVEE